MTSGLTWRFLLLLFLLLLLLLARACLVRWLCLTDRCGLPGQQGDDSSSVCLSAEPTGLIYSAAGMRYLDSGWKSAFILSSEFRFCLWTFSDKTKVSVVRAGPIPTFPAASVAESRRGPSGYGTPQMCLWSIVVWLGGMQDWPGSKLHSGLHEEAANVASSRELMSLEPHRVSLCFSIRNKVFYIWKWKILFHCWCLFWKNSRNTHMHTWRCLI